MAENKTLSTALTFNHTALSKKNQSLIDTSVSRYLESLIKVGAIDDNFTSNHSVNVTSKEHKNLSRKFMEESTVLLKNDDDLLPLSPHPKNQKILLIGAENQTFHPTTYGDGSGKVDASFIIPPAWEISDRLGVKRIQNTADPSRSCNITNGNCLIYAGHKNKVESIPKQNYDTVIMFMGQGSAET